MSLRCIRPGIIDNFLLADLIDEGLFCNAPTLAMRHWSEKLERALMKRVITLKASFLSSQIFLTHWSVEWSEPILISSRGILFAWVLFFGGILTIREIIKAYRDFSPLAAPREELGGERGQYGAEYIAELESKGIAVPGISAAAAVEEKGDRHNR